MIKVNDIVIAWLNQQDLKGMKPQQVANLYDDAYKKIYWVVNHDFPSKPGKLSTH